MTSENNADNKKPCKPCRCKRILLWLAGILLAIFVVLPLAFSWLLSPTVKMLLEKFGCQMLGCPVTVEDIDISLWRGSIDIIDFKVGSPEGFKTETMSVHEIYVNLSMSSLLSDTIIIDEILIDQPQITYEIAGLRKTNIGDILANLQNFGKGTEEHPVEEPVEEEEDEIDEAGGRKVCIRQVNVKGGKIRFALTLLGNRALPIPLPNISLDNIGGDPDAAAEPEGTSIAAAINEIFTSIFTSVNDAGVKALNALSDAGKAAGDALGKAADATGDALGKAADAAGEAIDKGVKSLKNLFK